MGMAQTVAGAILSRRGMPYDPISVNDTMHVRDVQGTWKLTVDGCVGNVELSSRGTHLT